MPTFDNVFVINLDRRADRLALFNKGLAGSLWPFAEPKRIQALDGKWLARPEWYNQQDGAWGCLQTHLRLYEEAMNNCWPTLWIFEDDCVFVEDSSDRMKTFFDNVPDDWDHIYLGGLPRLVSQYPPQQINDHVWRLHAVTGTWAMGMTLSYIKKIYKFMHEFMHSMDKVGVKGHLDRMFAEFHHEFTPKVYAPHPWIVGMAPGASDICNRVYSKGHYFNFKDGSVECPTDTGWTIDDQVLFPLAHARFRNGKQVTPPEFGKQGILV